MRRATRRVFAAGLLGVVAYGAACWILSDLLLGPHRSASTQPPPDLPERAFTLTSVDGMRLAGVRLDPTSTPWGNVAVFHGLEGARPYAKLRFLTTHGLRVFAIDFRAHGESAGEHSTFGWLERHDVHALLDYVRVQVPGEPLAAWGESLGAAALLYLGELRGDVDALVLECPYADIETAYWNRVEMFVPDWMSFVGYGPKWILERRLEIDSELLRPVEYVAQLGPERVFLARGELDERVTADEFARFRQASPSLELRTIPGAGHWLFAQAGASYRADLVAFLRQRFGHP